MRDVGSSVPREAQRGFRPPREIPDGAGLCAVSARLEAAEYCAVWRTWGLYFVGLREMEFRCRDDLGKVG
jgi:hypothetical protein